MVFTRPSSVPYPTIWHRFTIRRGGTTASLRVQDLTDDKKEEALALLSKHFTRDEPPCKYIECIWGGTTVLPVIELIYRSINKYPTAVAELEALWRKTVADRLSLVCVEDKDDGVSALVGVNVLTVSSKDDKDEPFKSEDKVWAKLFGAVDLVARSVDLFQKYGVDKYLTAYGLVVAPEWRGCSIGKEILKARVPLCKALGIKVTATVFTAAASQAVAKKAGFEDLYEITYEELARKGFPFPGVEEDTKSSKLMALVIN